MGSSIQGVVWGVEFTGWGGELDPVGGVGCLTQGVR